MTKKKLTSFIAAGAVAVASVVGLGVTYNEAFQIAFNTDKAVVYCTRLIEGSADNNEEN